MLRKIEEKLNSDEVLASMGNVEDDFSNSSQDLEEKGRDRVFSDNIIIKSDDFHGKYKFRIPS